MLPTRSLKGSTQGMTATGTRFPVILDNKMRTEALLVRLNATFGQAGAPGGVVKNGGSIRSIFQHAVNENGEDTYGIARAWMLAQLAEFDSGSPLGFTRLPNPGVALPIGNYNLMEQFLIPFGMLRQLSPSETYFLEADPSSFLQLDSLVIPNAIPSLVAPGGVQTLTNLQVTVTQIAAPAASGPLPLFKPRYRELVQQVAGINPQDLQYLKSSTRISHLVLAAEATDADGGTIIVNNAIVAARLLGDGAGATLIGPNQEAFADLVNSTRYYAGGDVAFLGATFTQNFIANGRLSNTIRASAFPNLRWELSDQLSGALPTRIVTGMRELTTPAPRGSWAVVSPTSPDWL